MVVFHGTNARSPFGYSLPSGSHNGTKVQYGGYRPGSTFISVRNYTNCCGDSVWGGGFGYGAGYGYYDGGYDYYGGGCCHHNDGLSNKAAWTAFGIGAALPFLPFVVQGLGWLGKHAIAPAAKFVWNKAIVPAAKWTYEKVLQPVGEAIGNAAKKTWNFLTGWMRKDK